MRVESVELYRSGGAVYITARVPLVDYKVATVVVDDALQALQNNKKIDLKLEVESPPRSLQANALLWSCLTKIAVAISADKWDVYEECLTRYTDPLILAGGVNKLRELKENFRVVEIIDNCLVNGQKACLYGCYRGSSKLNKKEFSVLLDGVISEMQEMGLETPADQKVKEVIEAYVESESKR